MPLTPDQKGSIAEAKIAAAAIELGVGVYRPINDGLRCDLVFDLGRLLRIQCKWAARSGDVVVVPFRSCRRGRDGHVRRSYTADEIDAVAAYSADLDACFLLPIGPFSGRSFVRLRLGPPLNNQRAGINWAADFDFAATLRRLVGP